MSALAQLESEIEELRSSLAAVAVANGGNLNHPDVVRLSMSLDRLIVEYERLKAKARQEKACTR